MTGRITQGSSDRMAQDSTAVEQRSATAREISGALGGAATACDEGSRLESDMARVTDRIAESARDGQEASRVGTSNRESAGPR